MPARLVFVRLPEGRLWHVEGRRSWTLCGRLVQLDGVDVDGGRGCEVLDGHVPSGAWVCRRCRDELAEQLHAVDLALWADPRTKHEPQDRLPAGRDIDTNRIHADVTPPVAGSGDWSAVAIWRQLLVETDGRPFTEQTYVDWIHREYLHPWGDRPSSRWLCRTRELDAGVRS